MLFCGDIRCMQFDFGIRPVIIAVDMTDSAVKQDLGIFQLAEFYQRIGIQSTIRYHQPANPWMRILQQYRFVAYKYICSNNNDLLGKCYG